MAVGEGHSVFPSFWSVVLPEWVTGTPCTRCAHGASQTIEWAARAPGRASWGGRLGPGPGVEPIASASGLWFRLLAWLSPSFG